MAKTVFINNENMATLACPKCGKTQAIDVSDFIDTDGPIKVKYKFRCANCDCGHSDCDNCGIAECDFKDSKAVFLERRRYYRKNVELTGTFVVSGTGENGDITVVDLSRIGVRFRPDIKSDFKISDRLMLTFHLDDKHKTIIKKETVIKKVDEPYIFAEYCFVSSDDRYDKAISAYLFAR
ncbi:PilZ domain-containing protein [Desulfococcaceae bacterium HSG8]|nr:PilZ domain-containing protein [Desulfococcaceae bacterium HSG8]